MAGLNCGTPSTIGWPMLRDAAFAFLSCQDEVTFTGMKSYHKGKYLNSALPNSLWAESSLIDFIKTDFGK